MSDPSVKQRLRRAILKAKVYFTDLSYGIIESDNAVFSFIATRRREARYVRVVLDRISDHDIKLVRSYELPDACVREIFCLKGTRFEIREVRE